MVMKKCKWKSCRSSFKFLNIKFEMQNMNEESEWQLIFIKIININFMNVEIKKPKDLFYFPTEALLNRIKYKVITMLKINK